MRIPEGVHAGRGACVRCGAVIRIPEERAPADGATSPNAFESDSGQPLESPPAESGRPAAPAACGTFPERRIAARAFEEGSAVKPVAPPVRRADHCARCGRTFRGAWDRNPHEYGPICSICARQASEMVPPAHLAHLPQGTAAPPTREELREIRQAAEAAAEPPPEARDYRGLVPFLIVSGLVMLAVLVLPVEEWMARLVMSVENREVRDVSPQWTRVLWLLVLAFMFLRELGAVYLGLHQAGNVTGHWLSDLADSAKYALILCAPAYIFMFVLHVPPLLAAAVGLLIPLVLWAFTSLDGMTVLFIFIFRTIMEPFMWAFKWLVVGGLGLLLT
jgi:hypothetical protein